MTWASQRSVHFRDSLMIGLGIRMPVIYGGVSLHIIVTLGCHVPYIYTLVVMNQYSQTLQRHFILMWHIHMLLTRPP